MKNASLEFYDEDDPKTANGMLIAMASKRLQAKIYHEPREGSWWSENPDVRGPRPPGQRPNSAKFARNREFLHEDDPQVIIDRGTADLMSDVDRARIKARRGINKAKRTVKSARVIRKEVRVCEERSDELRTGPRSRSDDTSVRAKYFCAYGASRSVATS